MADKLKDMFDERLVRSLSRELAAAHADFDQRSFVAASMRGLGELELMARGQHVAEALRSHLPADFASASAILIASFACAAHEPASSSSFRYLPYVYFVQKYGLAHFEEAMALQLELTQRFTAEWSIRAFLEHHPEATYARLMAWTDHPSVHVRRLVSEGTRPRLPWAPRLRAYQADPRPVIALLERLVDDPERYVQRSVANSVNDIARDHPALAVSLCAGWLKARTPGRLWIVQHGLRSLLKAGQRGALEVLGVGAKPAVAIARARSPSKVRIGEELRFSCELASTGKRPQELMVDFAVHFVKANGGARPKVFKLKKLRLEPGARVELAGKVSFAQLTTRTAHPGRHRLELLINGVAHPLLEFDVRA